MTLLQKAEPAGRCAASAIWAVRAVPGIHLLRSYASAGSWTVVVDASRYLQLRWQGREDELQALEALLAPLSVQRFATRRQALQALLAVAAVWRTPDQVPSESVSCSCV